MWTVLIEDLEEPIRKKNLKNLVCISREHERKW